MLQFGFQQLPLWADIALFVAAAVTIAVVGTRLSRAADRLADVTGVGEAIAGGLFLGAATSLPGIITSVVVAYEGHAEMAVSNAVGGIAAQTAFLVVADIAHRQANLEHAAASAANILQAALLVALLSIPVVAISMPAGLTLFGVHLATPLILGAYVGGLLLVRNVRDDPMWYPAKTRETREDAPEDDADGGSARKLWLQFGSTALVVGAAGFVVARTGVAISQQTGLSESAVGAFLTAVSTSLPELVTSIAAVRQGALTLAVGGVIGGNAFDTLFLAVSDVAYRDGSIYHAAGARELFLIGVGILMTCTSLMGMVRRERRGVANIGFEGIVILSLYACSAVYVFS